MAPSNPFTGLKRKQPKRETSRKKRETLSSTVSARMYSEQALLAFKVNMAGANMALSFAVFVMVTGTDPEGDGAIVEFLLLSAAYFASVATQMIVLDSQLLDVTPEEEAQAGFQIPLNDVSLDSYSGDDECAAKTRFTKAQIRLIIEKLDS